MAVEGLARDVIRQRIGQNLLGVGYIVSTATGGDADKLDLLDTKLTGGADNHNGKWILFTSGSNDGLERQISNYIQSSGTVEFLTAVTAQVAAGDTSEILDSNYSFTMLHRAINQAINSLIGRVFNR